jgi:hypothetical protein
MVYDFYQAIDPALIFAFRITENPFMGYMLGNLYLAMICTLIGELTLAFLFKLNRKQYEEQSKEMLRNQSYSIQALMNKSKEDFKATNRLANDAFGKSFFAGVAFSSSSLWPVPFALGWLGYRFDDIAFEMMFSLPLLGDSLNYAAVFLLLYILTRILGTKIRKKIFSGNIKSALPQEDQETYYTWADLHNPENIRKRPGPT